MARFRGQDLLLKDDDQIYFGTGQDSALWFDGSELRLDTTLSGVTPTEDYHLTRKDYVDGEITTHTAVVAAHHAHLDDEATATESIPTVSATYELMHSMTITPAAGTYRVHFSTSWDNTTTNTLSLLAIYYDTNIVSSSVRRLQLSAVHHTDIVTGVHTTAKVTVNGSEAITVQWQTDGGTTTAYERSLVITRVLA